MKVETLRGLIREGKKPLVRLTDELWDESFGKKGMIARVVAAVDRGHDGLVDFTFDYNENREHNLALDVADWFIGNTDKMGTAIEAGHFKDPNNITEALFFDPRDPVPVELVEAKSLLNEYLASGSEASYVEWLELQLNAALNKVDRLEADHEKQLQEIHREVKALNEEITARDENDAGESL